MREADRWSVIVVSRKLDGKHDGIDFGDGVTPVRLRLPFKSADKITLHKLAGDPRESNCQKLALAPQSEEASPETLSNGVFVINARTGAAEGGLPPGSILVYVFNETSGK